MDINAVLYGHRDDLTPEELEERRARNKALGLHPQFWETAFELSPEITPEYLDRMFPTWREVGREIARSILKTRPITDIPAMDQVVPERDKLLPLTNELPSEPTTTEERDARRRRARAAEGMKRAIAKGHKKQNPKE